MLQLSYSVAQEWCESCNFLSKRFQSPSPDCVGCAFCDDEGALPIVLAIEQDENFAPVDVAKGLPRISGAAAYPHPHHIHRSAEIDHFEACALADYRMAPVSPNRQLGANLQRPLRRFDLHARHSTFLLDEIGHLCTHLQVKCGITPGLLGDEVEEVPLWHESEETAVSREMGEIRNCDGILSHLTGELSYFLMRALQELVQNTEFMHNLECGWMDRVTTELTQEIGMLFEYENIDARPRKKKTQHHAGRATSSNAATSVNRLVHATEIIMIRESRSIIARGDAA